MQSPSHLGEAGQPSSSREGAGNRSAEAGRGRRSSGRPGRALGRQGVGAGGWSGTREAAVPPSRRSPHATARGRGARQNPKPRGPRRRAASLPPPPTPHAAAGSTCRGGPPSLSPPPRRRRKVFTPAPECRQLPQRPAALPHGHPLALRRPSPNAATEPVPRAPARSRAARAATGGGGEVGASGRLPAARSLLSRLTLRGKLPGSRWRPAPRNPQTWERRRGGDAGRRGRPLFPPPAPPAPARRGALTFHARAPQRSRLG